MRERAEGIGAELSIAMIARTGSDRNVCDSADGSRSIGGQTQLLLNQSDHPPKVPKGDFCYNCVAELPQQFRFVRFA